MDLTTKYLGLTLPHPIVPSAAQPLTKDLDSLKRLEDGGAAAVVIHTLFEEQTTNPPAGNGAPRPERSGARPPRRTPLPHSFLGSP